MEAFAYRPTYNQYRNSPRTNGTTRTVVGWIKYSGRVSICLLLIVALELIFGSDEQLFGLPFSMLQPYQHHKIDAFSIENFSSEDTPDQNADDAIPDTFYFLGGKPAWFDVTLEGRWMMFRQHLERLFGPFPPQSSPPKNEDETRRRQRPLRESAGPKTLSETQMLLLQEEEEGFQNTGNAGEPFRRRSIRGSSFPDTKEDYFLFPISVVL